MAANATELYLEMSRDIERNGYIREVHDDKSPGSKPMMEAIPGRSYVLDSVRHNIPGYEGVDLVWAGANVLHFFASTEEAECLKKYNKNAGKFLDAEGMWRGAYGYVGMPQVRLCIQKLTEDPNSRRAVVAMNSLSDGDTKNIPSCWSYLQFLRVGPALDMLVFQRSLNLHNLMAIDCILLTNILQFVAEEVFCFPGSLRWIVGSLHAPVDIKPREMVHARNRGAFFPHSVLSSPATCMTQLESGSFLG